MTPPEAGRLLGVSPPDLTGCRSMAEAQARLQAWKDDTVQAAWKREVRLVHPDRARDPLDRHRRTVATQRVNRARDVLREVEVIARRPDPGRVVIVNVGAGFGPFGGRSTATTAGFPWSF